MKMQRQEIDPPELFKHPGFKRVVTVQGDMKLVFIAGQNPSDENYQCVAPGDYRAQYVHVMKNLDIQLKAAGADAISEDTNRKLTVARRTGKSSNRPGNTRIPPIFSSYS